MQSASQVEADWLIVGVWEDAQPAIPHPPESLVARLAQLKADGDWEGKPNDILALHESLGSAARRVLLVGLGSKDACSLNTLGRAVGSALRAITRRQYARVVCPLLGEGSTLSTEARTSALVTGAIISDGGQDLYRTIKKNRKPLDFFVLADAPDPSAVERGTVVGQAVRWTADLVNEPPAVLYPASFCERVSRAADTLGVEIDILDRTRLTAEKMGGILGVGQGSEHEPRLLVLRYRGGGDQPALALVGKGITFDSGGLSIKTAEGMLTMKCDMAGAASVCAAVLAAARLKIPVNLLALAPLAENMLSHAALRPGDVLTAKNGMTIEVVNTDAEGRLVLADALCHAVDLGASHIVDVATLTGACVVALGTQTAGVMSNHEAWSQQVLSAGQSVGERLWPLPMDDDYDELIKSGIADMKNSGGRYAGAITAAKLLQNFVAKKPWVHIDIAGPAFTEKESPYQDAGGTGFVVRTLIALAEDFSRSSASAGPS
jgi:leucyl aminopeptidase